MKLFKKLKKGFTLVELIVVIAVIAILAATSVGVYFGVTESAKKSNDQTVTNQMNKALLLDATVNGAPATVTGVLDVLEENGFDVTKMSPFQDGAYYVWDSADNKMILLDKDNVVQFPADETVGADKENYFTFVANKAERTKYAEYSHYLEDGYEGEENEVFTTGVDVGNNYGKDVTYEGLKSVTIRTNGGNLKVNSGTVTHYGSAYYLSVNNSATYTERGTIVADLADVPAISNPSEYTKVSTDEQLKAALEVGGKIMLEANISYSEDIASTPYHYTVKENAELNLNGYNIVATHNIPHATINNGVINIIRGKTLTVSGHGRISLTQTGSNMGWGALSAVIRLEGSNSVLNIEDAVIVEHLGGTDMAFAIDSYATEKITINVNGGLISSVKYIGIRIFFPQSSTASRLNVNAGAIKGASRSIWVQGAADESLSYVVIANGLPYTHKSSGTSVNYYYEG